MLIDSRWELLPKHMQRREDIGLGAPLRRPLLLDLLERLRHLHVLIGQHQHSLFQRHPRR